jgi:hypothetical protein
MIKEKDFFEEYHIEPEEAGKYLDLLCKLVVAEDPKDRDRIRKEYEDRLQKERLARRNIRINTEDAVPKDIDRLDFLSLRSRRAGKARHIIDPRSKIRIFHNPNSTVPINKRIMFHLETGENVRGIKID